MKEITQQLVKVLFEYREGILYWKLSNSTRVKVGDRAGSLYKDSYYQIKIDGKVYKSHRLIFLYHHGYLPEFVDHIDGDKANNKIENLRAVTQSQNSMNIKPRAESSQYKGVSWNRNVNKWEAQITINGKQTHLGYFASEKVAALAYNVKINEVDELIQRQVNAAYLAGYEKGREERNL